MGKKEDGPDPGDVSGWLRVIESKMLSRIQGRHLVAAAQKIGPSGDRLIINSLMNEISDRMMRILRKYIGRNHRNEGRDMIEDTHGKLIEAVLRSDSADGMAMRTAFVATVKFRAADAIRSESLHTDRYQSSEEEMPVAGSPGKLSVLEEERAHVESVLNRIADPRKRLAFRLHMDGVPRNSKKVESIASALGVSAKTAETWIKETEQEIKIILGVNP
ncbi:MULTISPECIES: RNA polymerase sigma factor [Asticcacaulis]|uniref:RNA polymerase sigma factor n=1 Tax=Asticcacaulis TaxID=76890 RepID=UPI001AE85DEE|nr:MULTISPECIES: sigma-70 family RNA polymerase sigma factor [Asticcacaulis]MBP2157482.1 RNA polymerase sigma factor (sigma-70 family) [Asticcacaulis solisilvae]MDR6798527.1 RNA polymerase sigma factor (sigma-70 family) [Asticcacaulis sp. BE141]